MSEREPIAVARGLAVESAGGRSRDPRQAAVPEFTRELAARYQQQTGRQARVYPSRAAGARAVEV